MRESLLARLWRDGQLPIANALFTAQGTGYELRLNSTASRGVELGARFVLAELVDSDPEWLSYIHPLCEIELPAGDFLTAGEGSLGADGFFAKLDTRYNINWAAFFTNSNPFTSIEVSGTDATFTSTLDIAVTVNIDDPRLDIDKTP